MKRSDFLKSMGAAAVAPLAASVSRRNRKSLIRPKRLNEGDLVGLTAPAGIIFDETLFAEMERVLYEMGLRSRFAGGVRKRHGYLAGEDRQRAADLNQMFVDPEIDAILAVRGGWGCARILPYLDFKAIARNPKIYCGFSDNTTLHHAFSAYCGLQTFHGPNGNSEWTDLTIDSFQSVLMKGEESVFESNSSVVTLKEGTAKGKLIGGNLSILCTTLGTPYQPDFNDAILFVEDIGERTYKVDRMLAHLQQAGALKNLAGFIFGKCTDCAAGPSPTFSLREVLDHYTLPLEIPAIMNVDIGHEEDNFTLPVGAIAELNADAGTFRLMESAVI